jgi:hypothetical protein
MDVTVPTDIFLFNLKTHIDSPPHVSFEIGTLLLPVYAKIAVHSPTILIRL